MSGKTIVQAVQKAQIHTLAYSHIKGTREYELIFDGQTLAIAVKSDNGKEFTTFVGTVNFVAERMRELKEQIATFLRRKYGIEITAEFILGGFYQSKSLLTVEDIF